MIFRFKNDRKFFCCLVLTAVHLFITRMNASCGEAILHGTNATVSISIDTNTCHAFLAGIHLDTHDERWVLQSDGQLLRSDGQQYMQLGFKLIPDNNYPETSPPIGNAVTPEYFGKFQRWELEQRKRWPYVLATNSLCGPMLLYDAKGNSLKPLKPEVNRLSAYPDRFSLSQVERILQKPVGNIDLPIRFWQFSPDVGPGAYAPSFYLNDYFDIQTPGNYELRVWPKLYRSSATNDDIFERLDLPVLKIPLNLNPKR